MNKWMFLTRCMMLGLALAIAVTGCSLKAAKDANAHGLKIIIQDQQPNATLAGNAKLSSLALPGPGSSAGFSCFLVNIVGQGIGAKAGPASCGLTGAFSRAGTGIVSSPSPRGSAIEVDLPVGPARKIEVYGLFPPSEECGGAPGVTSGVYFLGSVTRDLFASTEVTIAASFTAGAASDLTCVPPDQDLACHAGSSWATLDTVLEPGGVFNAAVGIDFDSSGSYYTAGYGYDSGPQYHWLVRESDDDGSSWSTIEDFQLQTGYDSAAYGILTDDLDNIFVVGQGTDSTNGGQWLVRRSQDGGSTFSNVDLHQLVATKSAQATAIDYDSSQNIYVVGQEKGGDNIAHWVVRKSVDSGTTWTNVRDFQYDVTHDSVPKSIFIDDEDRIWVAGYAVNSGVVSHWLVEMSEDGGATWNLMNDFLHLGSFDSQASGVTVSGEGDIYVVGTASNGGGSTWLVRKSDDDGVTWSTVDDYQVAGLGAPNSIDTAPDGTIFVAGASSSPAWQVRASRDDGTTWSVVDGVAAIAGGTDATAGAIRVDGLGDVFVMGTRANGSVDEGLVRVSLCK